VASDVYLYLEAGTFELPEDAKLPQTHVSVPHILIPDDTYPVKPT
jgi:hypothetical protein